MRFLIGVVGLWAGVRAGMLGWWERPVAAVSMPTAPCPTCQRTRAAAAIPFVTADDQTILGLPAPERGFVTIRHPGEGRAPRRRAHPDLAFARTVDPGLRRDDGGGVVPAAPSSPLRPATPAQPAQPPQPPLGLAAASAAPAPASASRWSGSAWAFVRGNGASSLAGGGQLGGSQAGARIAYRVDDSGRIALAARAYLPTEHPRGSEAAVGIDLHPLPDIPFRLSVERRIAIGREGRDAWSAYAAGGFFRALPGSIELDGYGQAGVVGARAHDLFADGAIRLARRQALGRGIDLLAGAGAWGAAQPGAARLDVGPHVALRIPAAGSSIALAADWRFRVAGDARPGSGPTLTIASDF